MAALSLIQQHQFAQIRLKQRCAPWLKTDGPERLARVKLDIARPTSSPCWRSRRNKGHSARTRSMAVVDTHRHARFGHGNRSAHRTARRRLHRAPALRRTRARLPGQVLVCAEPPWPGHGGNPTAAVKSLILHGRRPTTPASSTTAHQVIQNTPPRSSDAKALDMEVQELRSSFKPGQRQEPH